MSRRTAERVADAVLGEGYALYPYRADALKNRYRWQFGALMPPAWAARPATEDDHLRAEVIVELDPDTAGDPAARPVATLDVIVRALHVEHRQVLDADDEPVADLDVGGRRYVTWEQGELRTIELQVPLLVDPRGSQWVQQAEWPAVDDRSPVLERGVTAGTVVLRREHVRVRLSVRVVPLGAGRHRVRVTVSNLTPGEVSDRADACRRAPVSTHVVLHTTGARIASMTEPAPEVADAVGRCTSTGVWPTLIGGRIWSTTSLCAPMILDDDPLIAPESATDLFDGTEIEEMLALRIATLTPAEQQAAAATDPRVAAAVERYLDPHAAGTLHARLVRTDDLRSPTRDAGAMPAPGTAITASSPQPGTRVRLRPRPGADVQDRFLAGLTATVIEVRVDLEGRTLLAVQLEDDPGAALREEVGRHLHFGPDEVELL